MDRYFNLELKKKEFMNELKRIGFSNEKLQCYERFLHRLLKLCQDKEIDISIDTKENIALAIQNNTKTNYTKKQMLLVMTRFFDYLQGIPYTINHFPKRNYNLIKDFEKLRNIYLDYCIEERNNSEYTVNFKKRTISLFFLQLQENGIKSLQNINHLDVLNASKKLSDPNNMYAVVKAFLTFACRKGYLAKDYSFVIPRIENKKCIPTIYKPHEIASIERAIPTDTIIGKRDKAMLLLCSRLGLRSCDVVNLRFSDVDMNKKELSIIQKKTHKPLHLPLLKEIEDSINEYLKVRPKSDEEYIFLHNKVPYQKVTTSVIRFLLRKYLNIAGINTQGKKQGPHSLRSSLASSMINDGTSYETVKSILGHDSRNMVKHYARIDIENLRKCALKPMEPSGAFKSFLEGGK